MIVDILPEDFLSTKGLMYTPSSNEAIYTQFSSKNANIFYGETYDDTGSTLDSMKYYLFVATLGDVLGEAGYENRRNILVADTAACRNVSDNLKQRYMQLGKERAAFVEGMSNVYQGGLNVIRMSDYINSQAFQEEVERVMKACESDPELLRMVEESVPPSKVDVEREKGFMYSYDELATILHLAPDLKVGPPREDLYDKTARELAKRTGRKEVMSVFLTPTYPLGLGWSFFFSHEDLETYGITAYKGGSKRLQKNRVLVERTSPEYAEELIKRSFISANIDLPNPVLDVGIIAEMGKQRLEGKIRKIDLADRFYNREISPEELKDYVGRCLKDFVLDKLA